MSEHWSEYWEQGHITSFGDAFKMNYQGEIKALWQNFSRTLDEHSKVLDIGTGNGAVIELIQSVSQHECVGIDLAKINDEVTKNIKGHFISHVSAEKMPFKDAEFDTVISQFALEYSDIDLSLSEIHRVLKSKGKLHLVCHHESSIIVKPNRQILEAGLVIKENMLKDLKGLVNALINNKPSGIYKEKIEQFISSFQPLEKVSLDATNFPAFYQFITENKSVDFEQAYKLFESELELLLLRLNELKQAAENTEILLHKINNTQCYSDVVVRELRDTSNGLIAVVISAEKCSGILN
ncbi:class I SAM-dependent methyltransferase [Pseudoalteromonas sp. SS15]|uniref:class I SAM-dependent methyltransferase n=1 Tax=Pseudoalteromonas sp. SS15 TaxID=3139393 RepID=UPI003BA88872